MQIITQSYALYVFRNKIFEIKVEGIKDTSIFLFKNYFIQQTISEEHEVRSELHVKQESYWSDLNHNYSYIPQIAHSVDLQD